MVTQPDVVLPKHTFPQFAPESQEGKEGVAGHDAQSDQPQEKGGSHGGRGSFFCVFCGRRHIKGHIRDAIDIFRGKGRRLGCGLFPFRWGPRGWGQRKRKLQSEGAQQPQGHESPQQQSAPTGRFFEKKAQSHHHQSCPSSSQADREQLGEKGCHFYPSWYSSTMRRRHSTSSGVRLFREEKAARKAGREPWKVSSTNFSLWAA